MRALGGRRGAFRKIRLRRDGIMDGTGRRNAGIPPSVPGPAAAGDPGLQGEKLALPSIVHLCLLLRKEPPGGAASFLVPHDDPISLGKSSADHRHEAVRRSYCHGNGDDLPLLSGFLQEKDEVPVFLPDRREVGKIFLGRAVDEGPVRNQKDPGKISRMNGDHGGHSRLQERVGVWDGGEDIIGHDMGDGPRVVPHDSDRPVKDLVRIGGNAEGDGLPRCDGADIRLGDAGIEAHLPKVVGDGEKSGSFEGGGHRLSDLHLSGDHDPVDRGADRGVGKIRIGKLQRRGKLFSGGKIHHELGLVAVEGAAGDDVVEEEVLVARHLDPVEGDLRLHLRQIGFGLGDLGPIDGGIDLGQDLPRPDAGIEVHVDPGDDSADLGSDMDGFQCLEASGRRHGPVEDPPVEGPGDEWRRALLRFSEMEKKESRDEQHKEKKKDILRFFEKNPQDSLLPAK